MIKERLPKYDPKEAFKVYSIKTQIEHGEDGKYIIGMIAQYINEGWMDWEQGLLMMKQVFEPEEKQ